MSLGDEETDLQKAILDALTIGADELAPDGVMCTHFVVVAEIMTVDSEYYLTTVTDNDAREWIHQGMLSYALEARQTDDYEEYEDEDEEDF